MNKASKMAMMYGLFAAMGNDVYGDAINEMTDEGIRRKKTKQIKQVKKIIPKGCKEFFYGLNSVIARNKQNADKKAKKRGFFIPAVVASKCEHKAKVLTKKEVEENRSNAYDYLDL